MEKGIASNKKLIGLIGVLLLISPNLNVPESILIYCGVSSHYTAMLISVILFAILDLILAVLFLRSGPSKKEVLLLLLFNLVYLMPIVLNSTRNEILQFLLFVTPVTLIAASISVDAEIRNSFIQIMLKASRILFIAAVAYIILLYVGTDRDQYGMVVVKNMTYGDMAYLFLTGYIASLIECISRKSVFSYIELIVFCLAIVFSGARSAVLCILCAVVVYWIVALIGKSEKNKKAAIAIVTAVTVVAIVFSMFILPSGSRFKVNNIDASSDDFSASSIIFETSAQYIGSVTVIYTPTNEERTLASIFEEQIVNNDCTKAETEEILRNDVINGTENYIKLIDEENDREKAENYRIHFYRTFLWRTAYKEFQKHPLIGNGPYYYKNKYNGYFPHNIFLEAMSDFGAAGLVLICALGLYCFVRGIKLYLDHKDENVLYFLVLLFSHFPRYLLYTTLYSNPTLALTVILFLTIGRSGKDENKSTSIIG